MGRAVLFPDPRGIDIYLTNRMYDDTWDLLVESWFNLDKDGWHMPVPSLTPGDERDEDNAPEKAATALKWDPLGGYFRFWILKPDRQYGTLDVAGQGRKETAEHWEMIRPDSQRFGEFLAKNFAHKRIRIEEHKYADVDYVRQAAKKAKLQLNPAADAPAGLTAGFVPMDVPVGTNALLSAQAVAESDEKAQPPPGNRLPWSTLVKFGLAVGEVEHFPIEVVVSTSFRFMLSGDTSTLTTGLNSHLKYSRI
jgi:hypothetical protein